MYCKKCGCKNEDMANFCKKCGTPLKNNTLETSPDDPLQQTKKSPDLRKIFAAAGIILIILAVITAAVIAISMDRKEKRYEEHLKAGNKYLEEEDYEKAEVCFNEALDIDPKQADPYIGLTDVYIALEDYEKAEEILICAENTADSVSIQKYSTKIQTVKKLINIKKEENKSLSHFTWIAEPEIEADDIFYTAMGDDGRHSLNELYQQFMSPYAIIQKGDAYGLIDMDGNMKGGMDYKSISGWNGIYLLTRITPQYEDLYQNDWDLYYLDSDLEDEFVPAQGVGCGVGFYAYYYYDGLRLAKSYLSPRSELTAAIPVKQSSGIIGEETIIGFGWPETLPGSYAVYHNQLVSEFIYDECGASSEGLLAVCKDGKWGYVDEDGKTVIPLEYDPTWEQALPLCSDSSPSAEKSYCYAASDGYVTLCKDGEWELRDLNGEIVIAPGIFEKIRPVYEDRCWVKKDGKWGVIELSYNFETVNPEDDESDDDHPEDILMDRSAFQDAVDSEQVLEYLVDDFDGDGTNEAFGITGILETPAHFATDVKIYFVSSDNQISLLEEDTYGSMNGLYEETPYKFLAWEQHAGGSGKTSYIYGVRDGNAYEFQISGQYRMFDQEGDKFVGYTIDDSQGFNDYIASYFKFDKNTKEFVVTD